MKTNLKKTTIILALLMAILILSIGAISANDLTSADSNVDMNNDLNTNLDSNDIIANSNSNSNIAAEIDEANYSNQIADAKGKLKESNSLIENENTEGNTQIEDENSSPSNKTNTSISIETNSIERGSDLTIYLKDINGTGIANEKLSIQIINKTYTRTTDSEGSALFKINLASGKYPITISYNGSEDYESSSDDFNISISPMKTKINMLSNSIVNGRKLTIELLDKNNNPLKYKKISIILNKKLYNLTTGKDGKASLNINLNPGKFPIQITFSGDANYHTVSKSSAIDVYKLKSSFTVPKTSIIKGKYLYVYLKDSEGKAISSAKVAFKLNGVSSTKTTDKNGRISQKIGLKVGYYTLQLSYNGDKSHLKKVQSFKIQSRNSKTKFTVANYTVVRGKYLSIYLKDSENANLANKKVTFTYLKKSYTKTTDSNGKASLKMTEAGTTTVNLQFKGSGPYLKSSANVKIKVLKNTTAEIIAKNQTRHLNGSSTIRYYVKLTDNNGNPIANETIELKVRCNNITTGSGNKINKKTIVLSSDNIINKSEDKKLLNEMAKILRAKGYKVIVSGIGPNYHVSDVRDYSNVCVFSLVGGVDSGMFVDMSHSYYKNYLKKYKNQFVLGCVAPPVYLNLGNMTWLRRAHDDDYSPKSFKGLYYPGKYFNTVTKLDYVYGDGAEELVNNFLNYAKYGKSIDLGQSVPKTTTTYKLTTDKNGNAYVDLQIGTYTISSSVLGNNYKVDTQTSRVNVIK